MDELAMQQVIIQVSYPFITANRHSIIVPHPLITALRFCDSTDYLQFYRDLTIRDPACV
jgi:hypothetical protein